MVRTVTLPAGGAKVCDFAGVLENRPAGIAPVLAALNVWRCAVPTTLVLKTRASRRSGIGRKGGLSRDLLGDDITQRSVMQGAALILPLSASRRPPAGAVRSTSLRRCTSPSVV